MITTTKYVTLCALLEVNVMHVVDMGHVKMDFANAIQTGSIMVEKNAYKHAREHRYAMDMVHASFMLHCSGRI